MVANRTTFATRQQVKQRQLPKPGKLEVVSQRNVILLQRICNPSRSCEDNSEKKTKFSVGDWNLHPFLIKSNTDQEGRTTQLIHLRGRFVPPFLNIGWKICIKDFFTWNITFVALCAFKESAFFYVTCLFILNMCRACAEVKPQFD